MTGWLSCRGFDGGRGINEKTLRAKEGEGSKKLD
jgi:hypothetical protein